MGSAAYHGANEAQEVVKQEARIPGAWLSLGMELDAEKRLPSRADPLVGAVIDVHEPGLPLLAQGLIPHGIAVVLAGDVTAAGEQVLDRLIDAPVAIGELVGVRACRQRQYLVAEANTEDRLCEAAQQPAHLLDQGT